ncbi:elongation factor G [Anaeromassilibacillus sp. An172]|uniref:elongation factor G n=1 Tax=Anaeromassilibacillus sp. An172 TaxID=1965570 RepID=UPI000B37FB68|nr:elongation factor G [Anaeromassilibacillus sp. An172]OUP79250.1 elongation factor G [Anaeromassilibacillus sp. An172]
MKQYDAKKILNIALAGHSGAGKTSVAESMIYLAGLSDRIGKIADGNTVLDYDPEEIKRKVSVITAVAPIEWKNTKINIIDTPGLFDFEGGVREGMRAADSALIVVSGKNGVDVGTEKAVKLADKMGLTKMFFVNGLCDESARFYRVFETLKSTFGPAVCPVIVPYIQDGKANVYVNLFEYKAYKYENGKMSQTDMPDMGDRLEGLRVAIKEAVAETSEELLDKFIMGEEFTPEEIILGVSQGVKDGSILPVFCGDAQNTFGINQLLDSLTWLAPSAADKGSEFGVDTNGDPVEISVNENGAAAAIVFKTVADPFVGKLSYFKVISGKISTDTPLINMRTGNQERITKVLIVRGKKQEDASYVGAGDIGAIPKLQNTITGDTLCAPTRKVVLDGITYPNPTYTMAIYPKTKGEEEKVAAGLAKLAEEDPTIKFGMNTETHEMIISGMGEQHLDVIVSKLKNKYNVDVVLKEPKIAYRETIRKKVSVQGRHKKQSGGHGQFGDVWIEFEPCDCDDLEFAERVVGGAVPKGFFPAVEKGLRDAIQKGPLAGYPVVGLKATLYDGSYHPVDSSEMSFKMAAAIAYKNGMPQANPTLLEPIGSLKAMVPDNNMGDIMGEVTKRRGRVLGMTPGEDGMQVVEAEVPMAEMHDFSTYIRQVTQGRGSFTFEFTRYEDAPANIAQKIIENAKNEGNV